MTAIDRQSLFSGTEAVPEHLQLNQPALAEYLRGRIDGLGRDLVVTKFKGGQSNPTYMLRGAERSVVLRRRPPGTLQPSAHAIDREYRVISALHAQGFPVPKPRFYCTDETVIGSAFYIVDCVDGRVFWNAELPGLNAVDRRRIYEDMIEQLARLHRLEPDAIGLGDFGPTENYVERNLARWSKIYQASQMVDIEDMGWLMDALLERIPRAPRTALLHGDYGLYNIIVELQAPRVRAILDWEMSTLGDPLVDLAHHVRPWWEVPDAEGRSVTSLVGNDLEALGIPSLEEYVCRYCERVGISNLNDWNFYLAYAQFRYAAMIQGVLKRAKQGNNPNRTVLHSQQRVVAIARLAKETLMRTQREGA